MTPYRVVPVPSDTAETLRQRRRDDYGNRLAEMPAEAGYPCRHCLEGAEAGDGLLLLSYSPFAAPGPYKEVGPIFLHAAPCPAYADVDRLPAVVLDRKVQVRAYDRDQRIIYPESRVVDGAAAEPHIQQMLANPAAAYVHVRSALNGCFLCRVERA